MRFHLLTTAALLAGSMSLASAQGTDTCATPTPIAGQGLFPFDNTAATTGVEGQAETICYAFGSTTIDNDVWFEWSADADGCARVETCGLTATDTKIAAYPGSGCPANGTSLACNDDACGTYQSQINWPVTNGATYTLQVGTFPGASGGTGTMDISVNACPAPTLNPSNGHYYLLYDGFLPWDQARDYAAATSFQGVQGHLVTISDAVEDDWVYHQLTGSALGNSWLGLFQDTNDPSYMEPAGGWFWVTGEPMTYLNWTPGQPSDLNGGENVGGYWPGDQWNDYGNGDSAAGRFVIEYDTDAGISYCSGDGSGTPCPCGNAGASGEGCQNSSGAGGLLAVGGSASIGADGLLFDATQLLPNQPALLFVGLNATNGGSGIIFGDGLRCAGANVVRLGVQVPDAGGAASWGPGLNAMGGWAAGDVRRFQCWYRDPAGPCGLGFNLSNGIEVVFTP